MSKQNNYRKYYDKKEDEPTKVEENITQETDNVEPLFGSITNCIKLNIREEPSLDSDVIMVLDKGTIVTLLGDKVINGFRKVSIDGRVGYCMSFYIEES